MNSLLVCLALVSVGQRPAGDEIQYRFKIHSYNVQLSDQFSLIVDLLDVSKQKIGSYAIDQSQAPALRSEILAYRAGSLTIIKQATSTSLTETWLDEAGRSVVFTGVYDSTRGSFDVKANDPAAAEQILAKHKGDFALIEALQSDLGVRLVPLASDPDLGEQLPDPPVCPPADEPDPLPNPPDPWPPISSPDATAAEPPVCESEFSVKGWGLGKASTACRAAVKRAHAACANEICIGCCELSESGNAGADLCDCNCSIPFVGEFFCGCTVEGKKCIDAVRCESGVGGSIISDGVSTYKVTIMAGASPDGPDTDGAISAYVWAPPYAGRFVQIGRQRTGAGKTTIIGTPPAGMKLGFYMDAGCAPVQPNNGVSCGPHSNLVGSGTANVKVSCQFASGSAVMAWEQIVGSNCFGQGWAADCDDAFLLIEKQ